MINRDEWLAALREAELDVIEEDVDALTSTEFAELFQVSANTALRRLNGLVAAGKAIGVVKRIQDGKGTWQRVPAYRLVKHETS